ncbi:MAG TPA: squalene cyclase [Actinospica sp.]|nr:squalene cyclase [Actinospica sp.]
MDAVGWLLEGDPAIRWQVMRDITGAPAAEVEAERAKVESEGWGARLLRLQLPHGQWTAQTPEFSEPEAARWWGELGPARQGTLFPQGTSTTTSLALLRDFGLPADSEGARYALGLVRAHVQWEHEGEPYFEGETEPCINGRAVAIGAYFGQDVAAVVERLLTEQMADGGWNCEQENGSTRGSFHTTINVLEGLLEYERSVGSAPEVRAARLRGQEYLVERGMLRRLSTGEVIDVDRKMEAAAAWTQFSYPTFWHYDVLRGLDYLREAGAEPDERLGEAVRVVAAKRGADGRWALENPHVARLHFALDEGEGEPSRWNTLRALRVLKWYGSPI